MNPSSCRQNPYRTGLNMNMKSKGIKAILSAAIVAVMAVILPVRQAHAQVVVVDPSPAIEVFRNQQWLVYLEQAADKLKEYKQQILDYKEQVSQGITQAKQLKQLYDNAKTFTTGDLPHFMSDLKGNPLGTLERYTQTLSSLAQDADQALGVLKQTNIKLNGTSYSLEEITGLSPQSWYAEVTTDGFHDEKMEEEAKKWAAKLSAKDKVYIRQKFHMSPEDYYMWYQKSIGLKKMAASAVASCSQWTEHAKRASSALQGYERQIAEMGMGEISDRQIAQMTNNLLYGVANSLEALKGALCSSQTSATQQYAVARDEVRSQQNKKYAEDKAWEQELEREEAKLGENAGADLYPSAPKNRGYPNLWK